MTSQARVAYYTLNSIFKGNAKIDNETLSTVLFINTEGLVGVTNSFINKTYYFDPDGPPRILFEDGSYLVNVGKIKNIQVWEKR